MAREERAAIERPPCLAVEKGPRIFCVWQPLTDGLPSVVTPDMVLKSGASTQGTDLCGPYFQVTIWAQEVARLAEEPVAPVTANLLNEASPNFSRLKVQIEAHRAAGGYYRIVDIAEGMRFTLEAEIVIVRVLYPLPGQIEPEMSARQGPGLVLDTAVGIRIAPVPAPQGRQLGTNTYTYRIAANDAAFAAPVPNGARAVTVYQTTAGEAVTLGWSLLGAAGPIQGNLVVDAVTRRVQSATRPGAAATLVLVSGASESERIVTLVWELEL